MKRKIDIANLLDGLRPDVDRTQFISSKETNLLIDKAIEQVKKDTEILKKLKKTALELAVSAGEAHILCQASLAVPAQVWETMYQDNQNLRVALAELEGE